MIVIHNGLRCGMLLEGLDCDWNTMFIRASDEKHIPAPAAKVAHVNVGRHVHACKMPYVDRAIGIRKRGSDRIACGRAS